MQLLLQRRNPKRQIAHSLPQLFHLTILRRSGRLCLSTGIYKQRR
jgi:hypothetical protein